jgi:hypothetical protein
VKIEGVNSELIALIVNDGTPWLENRLKLVLDFLKFLFPQTMKHHKSKGKSAFKSIHCDIWNRFSENVILSF